MDVSERERLSNFTLLMQIRWTLRLYIFCQQIFIIKILIFGLSLINQHRFFTMYL